MSRSEPRSPPPPGRGRGVAVALGLVLAAALAVSGCRAAPPPPRVALASVEPVYDFPREYRRHATLPCAEGSGLIYLAATGHELLSFAPEENAIRAVGTMSCPPSRRGRRRFASSEHSMAVDRSGVAWVVHQDGALYRVDTRDASCAESDYDATQGDFLRFGSAFVATGNDLRSETYFVAASPRETFDGAASGGLGRIVGGTKLERIGEFSEPLRGLDAELTGTGDGRLFGFFATRPATLAEIDPKTARILSARRLPGIVTGRAWAFAFWGGAFYFFWEPLGARSSNVSRLTQAGEVEHLLRDVGYEIVGAGVSTCAPTLGSKP